MTMKHITKLDLENTRIDKINENFVELSTSISGLEEGVFAYLTEHADTTVTTGDTFVPILGTFSNPVFEGFTIAADMITYGGTSGRKFEIDWHATVSCDDPARTVHCGVAIDGETLTEASPSVMAIHCKTADEQYAMGGTAVVELNEDDTIQLQLTSDANSDVVTVHHFTTTIRPFFI